MHTAVSLLEGDDLFTKEYPRIKTDLYAVTGPFSLSCITLGDALFLRLFIALFQYVHLSIIDSIWYTQVQYGRTFVTFWTKNLFLGMLLLLSPYGS